MAKTKTYKVGNEVYDIPENEANEFLSNFSDAIEVESFIVDKDTFDIPLAETQEFKTQFPTAQPLKKKVGTEPTQTDGKIGGTSGASAVQSTESDFNKKSTNEFSYKGINYEVDENYKLYEKVGGKNKFIKEIPTYGDWGEVFDNSGIVFSNVFGIEMDKDFADKNRPKKQSTESETGLFAPLQVPKMFAEKTLKVKETPAPKGQYILEREGQKANVNRDDIFKNLENEEFLKGVKSGEVKVDIQDDEALGNLLNDKLSFYKPKETYAIDGQEVSQQQMTEKLYDRDFVNKLQQDQVKLEFPETDTFIADLSKRQKEAGGQLGDKWDSFVSGLQSVASGVVGLQSYVDRSLKAIFGMEDVPSITSVGSRMMSEELSKKAEETSNKIRAYEGDFIDAVRNGNYLDATNMTFNAISGTLPIIGVGMATGGGIPALGIMSGVSASGELASSDGMKKLSGEELTEAEKVGRATILGTAEGVLGYFPTTRIVGKNFNILKEGFRSSVNKATQVGGKEAGQKVAQGLASKTAPQLIKEYAIDNILEVGGETATGIITDLTDNNLGITNYSAEEIIDRAKNNAAQTVAISGVFTSPSGYKAVKKTLDPYIKKNKEKVKKDIDDNPNIPKDQKEQAKQNIDKRVDAINAVPTDLQDNVEIIDLVQQKKELENQAKNLDPIFQGQVQEKISELEAELIRLANEKISIPTAEIKDLAQRIANGEKIESAEDLQLQANYPSELETELKQLASGTATTPTVSEPIQEGEAGSVGVGGEVALNNEEKQIIKEEGRKEEDFVSTRKYFKKSYQEKGLPNIGEGKGADYVNNESNAKEQVVNISDLIPTQKVVEKSSISSKQGKENVPIILKNGNDLFVMDGHHRIASELENGKTQVKAQVFDVTDLNLPTYEQSLKVTPQAGSVVGANPALKDVESTAKALENKKIPEFEKTLSEKQFDKKYIAQHKDLSGKREGTWKSNKNEILKTGLREGINVNALPIYTGTERNVIDAQYGNKKGDIVYILPKEGVVEGRNGYKTKEGYIPKLNEIVIIEYDKQPTYEAYKNQLKNPNYISEVYHKAKSDGSNPELVKAVEELLTPKIEQDAKPKKTAETAKEGEGVKDEKLLNNPTPNQILENINDYSKNQLLSILRQNDPNGEYDANEATYEDAKELVIDLFDSGDFSFLEKQLKLKWLNIPIDKEAKIIKVPFKKIANESTATKIKEISGIDVVKGEMFSDTNGEQYRIENVSENGDIEIVSLNDNEYNYLNGKNTINIDNSNIFSIFYKSIPKEKTEGVAVKKSEIDGERLSGFKKGDIVYRNYGNRYEEYEIINDKKDIWTLQDTRSGRESKWNAANNEGFILKEKTEQDAKEQQNFSMRGESQQETTERKGDSDMPIVNEAELQDREAVEEEVNEKDGNLVLPKKGEAAVKVGEVNAKFKDANKVMGEETTIEMPNGETRQSEYMVVELDDIMASHNEISFGNTDGFPSYNGENANTRNYKGDDKAKARVEENAQKLKPSIVISDTATPDSGVPIISKDGIIVSGNGRAMSIKRAKKQYGDKYDAYKEALIKKAAKFGIDANKVLEMKNPILVKIDNSVTEYTPKVFDDYNKPLQKAEAPIDKAIKRSNIIRGNNTLKNKVLEIVGRHETMSDLFANKADTKLLIENLVSNEVILPQEVAEFVNKDGTLTDSGKDLVNDILIATVLNAETLRATENVKGFRNKLINSLPLLSANYGLGDYSLEQEINDAIKLQSDVAAWGNQEDFWKYINQLGVFDVVNPNTVIINRLINSGKNNFKDFVRIYNQSAGTDEMNLFGAGEVLTKQQIIDNLKKSKLNEDERKIIAGLEGIYDDTIAQRQERDAGVAKEKEGSPKQSPEEIAKKDIDDAKKSLDDNLNKINKLFDKPKDKNDDKIFFQLIPKSIFGLPFRAVDLAEKYIYEKIVVPVGDAAAKSLRKGMESSNVALNEAATQVQGLIRTAPLTTEEITTRRRSIGEINSSILRALRFYENAVNSIGKDAQSLRNVHMVLDPEVYEKMGETPLTYDALNDTEKNLHDLLRATNDAIHDWHFINGKIDKETYDANKGKYIARFYEEIEFDDAPSSFKKTFTDMSKQMNFGYVKQRKELDEITLKALEDPVYATARRLGQMLKNQAIIDYSNEASRRVKTFNEGDANIPNNYVKLEGGGQFGNIKIWGDLTNKYVPIDLAEDLKGYMFLSDAAQKAYDFNKAYDRMAIRQFYKKLNTVYNPLVHVGNAVSNFSFAFWTGIDPIGLISNVPQAAKEVRENGDIYLELAREGVVASDVVTKDLTKSSKDILTRTQNANASSNAFRRVFDKFDEFVTEKYANTDDIAKVAAYITLTKDYKVSPKEAAKRVFDGFQNYSQVGRVYDLTSKTPIFGNPYVKFKADLLRIIKNGLLRKPLTMIGYLMLLKGFADLMSNLADEDEEDRRLREARAFIPKIPFPKSLGGDIPLVFQTKYGEVNAARYFSPFYIYDDANKSGVLEKASQFAPISLKEYRDRPIPLPAINDVLFGSIAQAIINEDFRGKRIQDPSGTKFQEGVESSEERLINALNYIGRQQVPFYSKTQDIINALNGDPDFYGRNKDLTQSLVSSVIKIEQMGNKEISENIQKNVEFAMKDLQALEVLKKKANSEYEKKAEEIQNSTKTEAQKEKEIKSQIDILTKRLAQLTEKQAKVKSNLLESTNKSIELKQPKSPKPQMGLPKQNFGKLPKQKLGQ
jgi:hypothetical protein